MILALALLSSQVGFVKSLDYFYDVHVDRAAVQATAAAYAHKKLFMGHRVVDQLVHKALAEPFLLRKARVGRRL